MPALAIAVPSFLAAFLKLSEEKITKKIKQKARAERERTK
tara:strand:- start:320 stop:439 length:120 start_codon:yes stop_codon:yes gene_type:complete